MAFLVHVPGLRKFSKDAKDVMMLNAWISAEEACMLADPPPIQLAVAIRGSMLYDQAWSGSPSSDDGAGAGAGGDPTKYESSEVSDMLAEYFKPAKPLKKSRPGDTDAANEDALAKPPAPAPATEKMADAESPPGSASDSSGSNSATAPAAEAQPAPAASVPEASGAQPAADFSLPSPVRDWTSADGRVFTGSLRSFVDDQFAVCEFVDESGKTVKIPVERFNDADKKALRSYYEAR